MTSVPPHPRSAEQPPPEGRGGPAGRAAPRRARRHHARTVAVFVGLTVLVVAAFVLLILQGSVEIPLGEVLSILTGGEPSRAVHRTIVLDARLPKALTAVVAGAALAAGGAQMQTIFRNPLADPFVLGVSSGATFGAAVVILGTSSAGASWLGGLEVIGRFGVTGAAIVGAGLTLVLALAVARRLGNPVTVLIVGVMFAYFTGAIVDVLTYYADPERLRGLAQFTRGTVRDVSWDELALVAPTCAIAVGVSILLCTPLNLLLLGERYAGTMGVRVRRVQFLSLATVAVLAGVTTAFCGAIGFIGLAAPHLVRGVLRTSDHRVVLPASCLLGAGMVLVAEYVAGGNGITDASLPLNSVTAFLGAPVVLWVLLRQRRESSQVPT
jgi:iron complex transport system permease protein